MLLIEFIRLATAGARARRSGLALVAALVAGGCGAAGPGRDVQAGRADERTPTEEVPMVSVRVFDAEGELVGPLSMPKVVKSEAEWKRILTPEQFRIVRSAGTERPFCGRLLTEKHEGVFTCVACGLPLFSSSSKFESGTGWPSFFQPIAKENVAEVEDRSHGMVRVEINCARCDGHLGHVFEDGPRPTGLRYCMNSESLAFTPVEELRTLADPAVADAGPRARVVLAGGCFWCVEAVFEELEGVYDAISGYAGGTAETANYDAVALGVTNHAEAVEILYDPTRITYEELLRVHFATHDPTSKNRQGADTGPQYRSAIFYADLEELARARRFLAEAGRSGAFEKPIVTTLEPLRAFYPAESYHQNYVCDNPNQSYVRAVAWPKVKKVRTEFSDKLKEQSPLEQPASER